LRKNENKKNVEELHGKHLVSKHQKLKTCPLNTPHNRLIISE